MFSKGLSQDCYLVEKNKDKLRNVVGKGKISGIFPQCSLPFHGKSHHHIPNNKMFFITLSQTSPGFYMSAVQVF